MNDRIHTLIKELLSARDESEVRFVCESEVEFVKTYYSTLGSQKNAYSKYRNAIRETFNLSKDEERNFLPLQILRLSREETNEWKAGYTSKVSERLVSRALIRESKVDELVEYARGLLQATSYIDRTLGIALLTGRRTSEVLCTMTLEPVADDDFAGVFDGQLKAKERDDVGSYEIPLLAEYSEIADALDGIRRAQPDLVDDPELARNRTHKAISQRMKRLKFADYIDECPKLTGRSTRQIYAAIASNWYRPARISERHFISSILGHGKDDRSTGASYEDFTVVES
jgi:hypothetical protein